MLVEEFLESSAGRFSDKIALICGDRRVTYGELNARSGALARALRREGVERGDRVAIFLENSVEAVIAIFATLKAGAVFLVVNPTTKVEKLIYILGNCRATGLVTDSSRHAVICDGWTRLPHVKCVFLAGDEMPATGANGPALRALEDVWREAESGDGPLENRGIDIDLAALIYTSGSTGRPKGVMVTHLNIVSAATSITTYLENRSDDIILSVLPLSFDYGLYQVLMAFKIGGTLVLERSLGYPHVLLRRIVDERVTGLPIVPTISAILLQMDLGKYDLSSLRYLTNTAAALPGDHIIKLRNALPGARIYSMYGLTECKRVSYLPPREIDRRPSSVGIAMPNEEVYIIDEAGLRVGPGVVGELVVRGSNVMKGYWELPEETARVLKDGPLPGERVLHTGDLFRMDGEGYLYFVGRRDDIIKTRGEKVSPREVEDVLYGLPGVRDAAVVGVADEILGQALKALLTLHEGVTLSGRDVIAHCERRLEVFMVPKYVEFRDSLPQTTSGKIDKKELGQTPASAGESCTTGRYRAPVTGDSGQSA